MASWFKLVSLITIKETLGLKKRENKKLQKMDLKIKKKQIIFIFLGEGGNAFYHISFSRKKINSA